jgi:hypothetical protein
VNLSGTTTQLPPRERRGSRLRCLLLTSGARQEVAGRLTALAARWAAVDPDLHQWLPNGLEDRAEAKLGETHGLLSRGLRKAVTEWWLTVPEGANTPNWDIASTATIDGIDGLILVEAKAHVAELKDDGKAQGGNEKNHEQIGRAIGAASKALNEVRSGWALSRDSRYQLANRFAWSWKLASLGVPVVLVYLGFLNADGMRDQGAPLSDGQTWEQLVKQHAASTVPESAWSDALMIGSTPMRALIRSMRLDIPVGIRR